MFFSIFLPLILFFSNTYTSDIQESALFKKDLRLVNVPVAAICTFPKKTSPYESQVLYGHCVENIGRMSWIEPHKNKFLEWIQVKTDDGIVGYMKAKDLLTADDISWRTSMNLQRISSLYAYVYPSPSMRNHQPIIKLPYNAYVQDGSFTQSCTTGDDECPWMKVFLLNNTTGWIRKGNVEPIKPLSLITMIERVKQFNGLPYLHGGTSPDGYDSEGFIQLIAEQMGFLIPRNIYLQIKDSNFITVEDQSIYPGDFLYFGKDNKITHAAFCIALNTIIHAAVIGNNDQVMITSIDHPALQDKLQCVRRLPPVEDYT
jgi:hypothetical protein